MRQRLLPCLLSFIALVSSGYAAQITHHDIEATIDPTQGSIAVVDVITVAFEGTTPEQPFGFFLNQRLKLTEASVVGGKLPLTTRDMASEQALRDYFPSVPQSESPPYAVATYHALQLREPDVLRSKTLRLRLVYGGVLADRHTPQPSSSAQRFAQTAGFIAPQGTYLSGSTFWVPQRPGELSTFTLRTALPEQYASVSQGGRVEHAIVDGTKRTTWNCPFPQQEIYLIAGWYTLTEERHGDVEIMTFLYQADPQLNRTYMAATKRYLDLYSHLIGPYPYQKFALVENFWQTGLGMPSFTLLGDKVIRLPFIVSTSYGHEILHNWWGNSVYVDWATGNWSEGLTTYGADYLYAEQQGPDAARVYRRGILQDYLNYVHGADDLPLKDFRAQPSPAARAVGYGKAAMVFHMLRSLAGEVDYWAALQQFYRDFRFKVASWEEIFSAFTAVTGRDLRTFKAQWIEHAGAPFISLQDVKLTHSSPPYRLEVVIAQSPPYALEVPVHIETARGVVRRTVTLSAPVSRRQFTLQDRPLAVDVDPDFEIFRRLHREEVPPTMGQALGATSALIVVPSQGDATMIQAYDRLASQWAADRKYTVIKDDRASSALAANTTVWVFGTARIGALAAQALPSGPSLTADRWRIAGTTYDPTHHSLVLSTVHPQNPDQTVNWLIASDPQWVPVIGQKLRYYGKYSYLVFAANTVIGKGTWPLGPSPLRREIP